MSLFGVLAALQNRRARTAAGAKPGRRTDGPTQLPGFTARDKKHSAGTKAGFGRRSGRSVTPPAGPAPSARPARAARQARASGGIRGFVSSIFSRLRST